ncbi:DUF1192 domain-containing protein [Belnapia sp. T6]|uniref:DUF1192 domain-containing protein n=1 Tax=Belnapia mucosa TaxID=2804532 RepID=A0ABS1V194_9PROT|nr:DUF1192 domain-containing protein [Belnapia mucosa]MBL6455337.1 DUF1192 domain-containing protein [Belnapia mucosa]
MFEEESPRPVAARFMPAQLDRWDVEELRQYIDALRAEIARAEAMIAARQTHRGAADALFRKPGGG